MIKFTLGSLKIPSVRGEEEYVRRVLDTGITADDYRTISEMAQFIGVTEQFKDVLSTFPTPNGETPAGFRRVFEMDADKVLRVDLARDIACGKNGGLRPTSVLFSADSANPYEIEPISPFLSNLTCNPGILYDLFINNPKANVGGKYKNRDEVMEEIGRILGPGCDISVELNNPFEEDFEALLEEAAKFREMLSKYRVVIKVPHTGAVSPENVEQLLKDEKKLGRHYADVDTVQALRGHRLALKLHEHGYRINFTLMFEPYQTLFALQARPYFINTFLRHRLVQSTRIKEFVDIYSNTQNLAYLVSLRKYLVDIDYLAPGQADLDLLEVLRIGRDLVKYRHFEDAQGCDGLDSMRHNLRVLRNCNLTDTRLIVCSMEGDYNYPDIDKVLSDPEFQDMNDRVVITAEPNYIARFTSTNQVTSYQRRFMNAVQGQS